MKTFALRLNPDEDLKKELIKFTKTNSIRAGVILGCAGSLKKAVLRLADENTVAVFDRQFEIVSLVGTLSQDDVHVHISLSDSKGIVTGGHLKEGCIVLTTAEIVVGELEDTKFSRKFDKETGYEELVISKS
jgi:predicted DNA-binding protein with PD1-like motif